MSAPRICVVGGIFDQSEEYIARRAFTPETVLVDGLRASGWEVEGVGHHAFDPDRRYDLVHVHHLGRAALRMALSRSAAPFVYSSHDPLLASNYQVSRRRHLMTKLVVERADATVALSDAERETDARRFGSAVPQVVVIPNGFPAQTFSYAPPAVPPVRPVVQFVGQLIPQKGVDVLLQAFARLDPAADLLLAYQNPAMEGTYRDQAAALGIADRVRFLGMQSSVELADRYREASVLVSASFAEALPSVVIEALMCGTPVIATDVGGVAEILAGEQDLVPPGDVGALAAALRERLANPVSSAERAAISGRAIARYSPAAMVAAHEALYRDLLAQTSPPRRARPVRRLVDCGISFVLARAEPLIVGRGLLS
jgi:glycosyltransferase involved in cell wall biosynthesis